VLRDVSRSFFHIVNQRLTSSRERTRTRIVAMACDKNARGNDIMSKHPTLQQFLRDHDITRDEKQIRRALRAKFRNSHEHNARWFVNASVAKFLRSHFARDFENARKRADARKNAKAKTTTSASS
jgi:hypothetical protein